MTKETYLIIALAFASLAWLWTEVERRAMKRHNDALLATIQMLEEDRAELRGRDLTPVFEHLASEGNAFALHWGRPDDPEALAEGLVWSASGSVDIFGVGTRSGVNILSRRTPKEALAKLALEIERLRGSRRR